MKTSSWLSKSIKITAVLALATAAFGFVDTAKAVHFNYVGNPVNNSLIVFHGDTTFDINPAADNFVIITPGPLFLLHGDMTGTFTIGVISNPAPNVFTAPVTGTGTFVIHDGAGFDLTATLTWKTIAQVGTGNALNIQGQANLVGISYLGANTDLIALANAGSAANVLTFQFVPAVLLQVLRDGPGEHSTSFSGTVVSLPDGGTTIMLLGVGLGALGMARRFLKK